MRAEVSCLFHLEYHPNVVKEALIGSGVYLQEILFSEPSGNWLNKILTHDHLLKARQEFNWGPYTHRFYISLDEVTDDEVPLIDHAQQLIIRAIVLSRIIQPVPIATGGPWVKSFYPDSGNPYHLPEIGVGFYGSAYTSRPHSELTITKDDAARMAKLWANLQYLFDNEEKYRRIIRALKYFDGGYHMYLAEFRHMVFCAALESLICTSPDSIKSQFAQRLPRLVPEITEKQALTIYNLLNDFKHKASPWQTITTDSEEIVADNKERYDAVRLAETSLRLLLMRAVTDRAFADLLADREEFARQYPVAIKKGKPSSIGSLVVRDTEIRSGRPIVAGTRMTVARVVGWYKLGLSPEEIAGRIGLSLAQVYAALTYYHANRDEIEADIAAEEAEAYRLEQEHYSSLQSRS